ncbi:hypothetical protein [Methanoculleus sp. UBA303]|uniref:hypothetical protein n=1 Tax=Methanoculleus sp. UBA303 TaxID=1915497 RepID=UPI0025E2A3AC|nr:hypothetical protein [Methanoculleus sp. UBA303]
MRADTGHYALWDSTVAVGMALGLVTLFRDRFDYSGRFARFLSRHSYAVYVIHAPVIVFVAVAISNCAFPRRERFVYSRYQRI